MASSRRHGVPLRLLLRLAFDHIRDCVGVREHCPDHFNSWLFILWNETPDRQLQLANSQPERNRLVVQNVPEDTAELPTGHPAVPTVPHCLLGNE